MTRLFRVLSGGALLVLVACGGDSTAPPRYPAVAGTYNLQGTFASLPSSAAFFSGTVTFVQPDRDQPGLTGTASVTVTLAGSSMTLVQMRNATVTEGGSVAFEIPPANTSSSWLFRGTLTGNTITGDHTLIASTGAFAGNFTATKR